MKNQANYSLLLILILLAAGNWCFGQSNSKSKLIGTWTIKKAAVDTNQNGRIDPDEIIAVTQIVETYSFEKNMTGKLDIGGSYSANYNWSLINNDHDILLSSIRKKAHSRILFFRVDPPNQQSLHIEKLSNNLLEVSFTVDNQLSWYSLSK